MPRTIVSRVAALPMLVLLAILHGSDGFSVPSIPHRLGARTNHAGKFLPLLSTGRGLGICRARRPRDEDDYYDDDDDDYRRGPQRRGGRDLDNDQRDYLGYDRRNEDGFLNIPSAFGQRDGWRLPDAVSKSLLAGVFILGIGLGVTVDSAINTNPKDLASRDAIDQAAPNSKLCADMGASAMAFDQRVFVSFNPFNVYVAQADVKPACVLRSSNVVPILKGKKLINDKEVFACKANMNTWAFVGDLDNSPQLSCVYKSEDAQNEFLSNPKYGIGEDYLDDDRANTKKLKVDDLTASQRAEMVRKRAAQVPGLD